MDTEQNQLVIFNEELIELAMEILLLSHQVSKAIRFGADEIRDLSTTNKQRIETEWNDLLGSLEKLKEAGIHLKPDLELIKLKMAKIDEYSDYSRSLGKLE